MAGRLSLARDDATAEVTWVVTEGRPWPMGVHVDAGGINVAVFSAHAQAIDLCLFDAGGTHEVARLRLPMRTGDVWHGHVAGVGDLHITIA